ncbi:DNA-processing protein DprA [Guggenheimella bovis]
MILEKKDYPEALLNLYPALKNLYYRGNLELLQKPNVVIVGTRQMTGYARSVTELLVEKLVSHGIVIISGFAEGVDFCAQSTALALGGESIGVLGSGVFVDYPKGRQAFFHRFQESLLLLSEYSDQTTPKPYHFPMRNRILAALSQNIVVIEGSFQSGTLITAKHGLEQGKNIWALPHRTIDELGSGCNWLISQGAYLLDNPQELIEDILRRNYGRPFGYRRVPFQSEDH